MRAYVIRNKNGYYLGTVENNVRLNNANIYSSYKFARQIINEGLISMDIGEEYIVPVEINLIEESNEK